MEELQGDCNVPGLTRGAHQPGGLQSSSDRWGSGGTGALVHVCVRVCSGNLEHTPLKPIPVGLPLGRWRHVPVPTTGGPGCPMSIHSDRRVFFSSVSALYSQALARVYCQCSCEWTTRTRRRSGSASGISRPVTTPRHLKFPYAGRPRKGASKMPVGPPQAPLCNILLKRTRKRGTFFEGKCTGRESKPLRLTPLQPHRRHP